MTKVLNHLKQHFSTVHLLVSQVSNPLDKGKILAWLVRKIVHVCYRLPVSYAKSTREERDTVAYAIKTCSTVHLYLFPLLHLAQHIGSYAILLPRIFPPMLITTPLRTWIGTWQASSGMLCLSCNILSNTTKKTHIPTIFFLSKFILRPNCTPFCLLQCSQKNLLLCQSKCDLV